MLCAVQDEVLWRMRHGTAVDVLGIAAACKVGSALTRRLLAAVKRDRWAKEPLKALSKQVVAVAVDATAPAVVLNLKDRAVLYKPPGWEVHDGHLPRQLSSYAFEIFKAAILGDKDCHRGFVHRLDVPNSGILLWAKSRDAYWDLQLQLASGRLARTYAVLGHGLCAKKEKRTKTSMLSQCYMM